MPETVTEIQITPIALRVPWREAANEIAAHLKIGRAIKNQRIRDQWELDHARAEKAEWIRRTTELLNRVFTSESVSEQAGQYVGPVLPEYAEFDLFVEQFEDEMRHRLGRLQGVLKQLDTLPEAVPSASGEAEAAEPAASDDEQADHVVAVDDKSVVMEERDMNAVAPAVSVTVTTPSHDVVTPPAHPAHPAPPRQVISVPRIAPMIEGNIDASGLLILASTDESARKAISEFLHDLGFKIEIIDRVAQPGRSVIDLLDADSDSTFAVVVADAHAIKETFGEWQFELGYCAGRLGAGRVCVTTATNEALADKHGIRHLAIDPNGGWQLQLARHLRRAGIPLDLNRLC